MIKIKWNCLRYCLFVLFFMNILACQGLVSTEAGLTPETSPVAGEEQDSSSSDQDTSNPNEDPPPENQEPQSYSENFSGNDGDPWPSPWEIAEGSSVLTAQISGNRARLQGPTSQVARMVHQGLSFLNCDGTFTIEFEDFSSQGVGLYCRQNGGYLTASDPTGQGYGVFLEGNSGSLTLWYERDGDEIQHQIASISGILANPLEDNQAYRIRHQVQQISPTHTQQRAKLWPAGEGEPTDWHVLADEVPLGGEPQDNPLTIPELQNINGGIALDIYNYSGTGSIYISDLWVTSI